MQAKAKTRSEKEKQIIKKSMEKMRQELKKPEVMAVFHRLKNK